MFLRYSGLLFIFVFACAQAKATELAKPSIARQFVNLPLAFERQPSDSVAQYVAHGQGYQIYLSSAGALIRVQPAPGAAAGEVFMEFAGGRTTKALAGPELPGKVNYILGNDPRQWQLSLPTYERVTYQQVYPGVDLVYRGNQRQLEFDLMLQPGTDVGAARLKLTGARGLRLDANGALVLGTDAGDMTIGAPEIYQEVGGARKAVRGRYKLLRHGEVAFQV